MRKISWVIAMTFAMLSQACVNERGFACSSQCDCERGYFCNNRGRCIRECRSDNECPCGSYCASSCGLCIRADNALPATCRAIGSSVGDILGACLTEPSASCRPVADAAAHSASGAAGGESGDAASDATASDATASDAQRASAASSQSASQCTQPLPIVSCMEGFVGGAVPTPDVTIRDADNAEEAGAADASALDANTAPEASPSNDSSSPLDVVDGAVLDASNASDVTNDMAEVQP